MSLKKLPIGDYVHFEEHKDWSAWDHIKMALKKANKKDWFAYSLIAIFVALGAFSWYTFFDDSYANPKDWKSAKARISWGLGIIRGIYLLGLIWCGMYYLIDWYIDKHEKK